jgi:LysM repeat protein
MPPRIFTHRRQWLILIFSLVILFNSPAAAQGNQHVVQRGETLFRIALRYGVTVEAISQANGIANPNQILVGQALNIPGETETAAPAPDPAPAATAPVYHVVQPGETLRIIGNRYGVTWQDLATLNNISNPNRILVGQQLVVMSGSAPDTAAVPPTPEPEPATILPEPAAPADPVVTAAPSVVQNRTHVVQAGEHLASIARRYGISWSTIAQANNIVDPNRILVGQALTIPGEDTPTPATYLQPTTGQPNGPAPTVTNGKQIIVDLSAQRILAYQDGQLMREVVVSTGLPNTPTVTGDYNIYWKLSSQTMSGPGYYLPGVPWVMYFFQGYAIHGTYWHNNFGQPMSHGCVNLPTPEAEWFFSFAEVGTPVRVVY